MKLRSKNNSFHQHKSPLSLYDVDIEKLVVSNRVSFTKKVICHKGVKELDV